MAAEPAARRIGLIIVGDEILSGRRQDKHFSKVVELLSARGMQLGWAEFLPDDRDALTAAYRRSFASGDVVLSCGGIGGTPDDHTRQAAAARWTCRWRCIPKRRKPLRCAPPRWRPRGRARPT